MGGGGGGGGGVNGTHFFEHACQDNSRELKDLR